ncbi:MAG: hypothetical protein QXP76_01610 [Acidilobaceae archaeon]
MRVTTGSRLHAGFYHIGYAEGWNIVAGGAGFYINYPRAVVEAKKCNNVETEGFEDLKEVVERLLFSTKLKACLKLLEGIPRHVGLGSTTQTVLAALLAALLANGIKADIDDLIELSRRAHEYSSIGSLLFKYGGFVVESGVPAKLKPYEPLVRLKVPEDWRFVIALPSVRRGLDEISEKQVMEYVLTKSTNREARLLMSAGCLRLASGIARGDLEDALTGLAMMQRGTGMVFSSVQGGVFREDLESVVEVSEKLGVRLAQSSWGPALYTITTVTASSSVRDKVKRALEEVGLKGEVFIVDPRNEGASFKYV